MRNACNGFMIDNDILKLIKLWINTPYRPSNRNKPEFYVFLGSFCALKPAKLQSLGLEEVSVEIMEWQLERDS